MINNIVAAEDSRAIYQEFKKIILMSVGQRSADGKKFLKTQEFRDEFEGSEAFSELVVDLLSDADGAAAFVNGLAPNGFNEAPAAAIKAAPEFRGNIEEPIPSGAADVVPKFAEGPDEAVTPLEPKTLTRAEAIAMEGDELRSGLATGKYLIGQE